MIRSELRLLDPPLRNTPSLSASGSGEDFVHLWIHGGTPCKQKLWQPLRISGGNGVLARTAAGTLAGDDRSMDQELTTPDAPWLCTVQCAGEALDAYRACPTQGLGELDISRALCEPELGVGLLTRDVRTGGADLVVQVNKCGELHQVSPPSCPLPRSGGDLSCVSSR